MAPALGTLVDDRSLGDQGIMRRDCARAAEGRAMEHGGTCVRVLALGRRFDLG